MEQELRVTEEFYNHILQCGVDLYTEWEFKAGDKVLIITPVYLRNTRVIAVDPLPTLEIELTRKIIKKGVGWYMGSTPVGFYDLNYSLEFSTLTITPTSQAIIGVF